MLEDRMSAELGLDTSVIWSIAVSASYRYKEYSIKKRGGGVRWISHPARELKALQRWLVRRVIGEFPVHECAFAYRHKVTIWANAQEHVDNTFLLRMDLTDFFPSIQEDDINTYLSDRKWETRDIELFAYLVCKKGVLTIGAPSSPSLSNALCYTLDQELSALANRYDATYTRYADDIFFSTSKRDLLRDVKKEVQPMLDGLSYPHGFKVNNKKTRHSSKRGCRRVTGIVLGSDNKAYVGRKLKRYVRSLVYNFDSLNGPQKASLAGYISYIIGFDRPFLNSLILKFGHRLVAEARGLKQ